MKNKNKRFEAIKPYIQGKKVLDIGVVQHDIKNVDKDKWLHRLICEAAEDTKGIDIDKEGINYLKEKGYNVEYADAQEFDLNEKFDVVVAGELIEYLDNFQGFLKSVKKHLKQDGLFILTTPNVFYFRHFFQVLFFNKPRLNPEHTCWFDENTLKQLLNRYGFKEKSVHYATGGKSGKIGKLIPLPKKLKHRYLISIFQK